MVGVLVVHQILQFADILFHNQMHGSEDSQGLGNVRLFQWQSWDSNTEYPVYHSTSLQWAYIWNHIHLAH